MIWKPWAFISAEMGSSFMPWFAASGSSVLRQILLHTSYSYGRRQGVIVSASGLLQPMYWLLISITVLTTCMRHRNVQGDWH